MQWLQIRVCHHYLFSKKFIGTSFFWCLFMYIIQGKKWKFIFFGPTYLILLYKFNWTPLWGQIFFCFVYRLHGTQNDRLELTVSMRKSVLKNTHWVLRYWPKSLKIWRFGLATSIWARFGQYLRTQCIFFKTDFCVETVSSSWTFRVPWSL